jgi:hypothetical protein
MVYREMMMRENKDATRNDDAVSTESLQTHTHLSATSLQPFIDYTQRKHRSKSTQIPANQSDLMQQLDSNDSCTGPAVRIRLHMAPMLAERLLRTMRNHYIRLWFSSPEERLPLYGSCSKDKSPCR